jgi:hypothetical protein
VAACEALGFAAGGAALHVDDLPVAECQDLETLLASSIGSEPLGRADDLVGADLSEPGLNLDASLAALLDLELQDLTGLVGAASGRRLLPPEVAMRNAAPLVLVSDQRRERLWVTPVERFGCSSQLIDHRSSMPRKLASIMSAPTVELLYFEGCPNVEAVRGLVQRVAADAGITPDLRFVEVTPQDVGRFRFLGSPTVRVNGQDVEPGADERTTFMFACRVYATPSGLSGQPAREWLRAALTA